MILRTKPPNIELTACESWLRIVGAAARAFVAVAFEKWIRFGGGRGDHTIPEQKFAT